MTSSINLVSPSLRVFFTSSGYHSDLSVFHFNSDLLSFEMLLLLSELDGAEENILVILVV